MWFFPSNIISFGFPFAVGQTTHLSTPNPPLHLQRAHLGAMTCHDVAPMHLYHPLPMPMAWAMILDSTMGGHWQRGPCFLLPERRPIGMCIKGRSNGLTPPPSAKHT